MNTIIQEFENQILRNLNFSISNLQKDKECEEYFGYNFKINVQIFKFRKAKITPKKVGQFVTLWKRNDQKITEPFHENDGIDYVIIATEDDSKLGFFIFPKAILIEKNIFSTEQKDGKRGFRVYPNWSIPTNKQALKTQNWQLDYFIEIINNKTDLKQVKSILKIKKGA